jgi:predicted O-linked N-acetylglucosamine transferase (SPINDLY family)
MTIEEAFAQALRHQLEGRLSEAEAGYRAILAREPERPVVEFNLGIVLRQLGRLEEAVHAYQLALALKPLFPEAHNNLGSALIALGRIDESIVSLRSALAQRPSFADAWNNLGAALKSQGKIEDAVACLEKAMRLQPENVSFHSNFVFAQHYRVGMTPADLLRAASRWNEVYATSLAPGQNSARRPVAADGRLRVGYVSANFKTHCQALFTVPLLTNHDHRHHEITCYSDVTNPDDVTVQLQSAADRWRPIAGLADEQVAELIRQDGIDVLVDLTLHMSHNRLLVFARKPAPVQVTWLGYPGTTGLTAMDHRLSDPWLDPEGAGDACYAERTYRLPETFWCYYPLTDTPTVNPLPATSNGLVTFGSLNNFCKVNHAVLAVWAQVLVAVPRSRLVLLAPPGQARAEVISRLGIGPERVEFVSFQPRLQYLELYRRIDIGLDTFPYNGHTTSMDALWMGVPVLTLRGETVVSRAGHSLLANLGLHDWVTDSPEAFVERAVGLASGLAELASLRASLRSRMEKSPLMDAARFARNIENAYAQLYRQSCARPVADPG